MKHHQHTVNAALAIVVALSSSSTLAQTQSSSSSGQETRSIPIEECAVQKKIERKNSCLGTGVNGHPARDIYVHIYNRCTKEIGVKQCFEYPNGKIANRSEKIKPLETEELYRCTQRIDKNNRLEAKPTKRFVYDPKQTTSYKFKCKE